MSEIYLGTTDLDLDNWYDHFAPEQPKSELHHAIFCMNNSARFMRSFSAKPTEDTKVSQTTFKHKFLPKGKYTAEGGFSYDWGGKDDGFSAYLKGSANDDNGNSANIRAEINDDWSGNISASVRHEEDTSTNTEPNNDRGK